MKILLPGISIYNLQCKGNYIFFNSFNTIHWNKISSDLNFNKYTIDSKSKILYYDVNYYNLIAIICYLQDEKTYMVIVNLNNNSIVRDPLLIEPKDIFDSIQVDGEIFITIKKKSLIEITNSEREIVPFRLGESKIISKIYFDKKTENVSFLNDENTIFFFDTKEYKYINRINGQSEIKNYVCHWHTGKCFYSTAKGIIKIREIDSGITTIIKTDIPFSTYLKVDYFEKFIVIANDVAFEVWNISENKCVLTQYIKKRLNNIEISANGSYLYVFSGDRMIQDIELEVLRLPFTKEEGDKLWAYFKRESEKQNLKDIPDISDPESHPDFY